MSFELGPIKQPAILSAQSSQNDGGSKGGTGYMARGKKKKEEEKDVFCPEIKEDESIFGESKESTSFFKKFFLLFSKTM